MNQDQRDMLIDWAFAIPFALAVTGWIFLGAWIWNPYGTIVAGAIVLAGLIAASYVWLSE